MLVLSHVIMEPSNVRKKKRKPPNMTKEQSHVMLELYNVRMESLNVRKNKKTIKCDKRTLICDVRTAQCEDAPVKCEKKKNEPPNVTKELSQHVMLELHNVKMESSNVRKK